MTQKRTFGNDPNQVPKNKDLGTLAYQDADNVNVQGDVTLAVARQETQISNVKPSLLLDFAKSGVLDPRVTFTRASTAAYYDGRSVAVAEQNLLTYSQDFTNAAWTKTTASVVSGAAIAPDGTMTATAFMAVAGTGTSPTVYNTVTPTPASAGLTYVSSIHAKAGSAAYLQMYVIGISTSYVDFDLSAGTVSASSGFTGSIVSLGNGWYRCSVVYTTALATNPTWFIANSSTMTRAPTWNTTGSEFMYLWGAQLEQRSAVSAYTPTTSSAITNYIPALQYAAANVPRFDYDPITGEAKGFLVEEQRTNLVTYSDDLSVWSLSNATIQSNTIIAPDGTLTGDKVIPSTASSNHYVYRGGSTNSQQTHSIYVKFGGYRYVKFGGGNAVYAFDLTGGVFVNQNATMTSVSVGNGWYRLTVTYTMAGGYNWWVWCSNSPYLLNYPTDETFNGDGWNGVYVWGTQAEVGAFATSYIPTTSGQVTRSRDDQNIPTAALGNALNASEGTLLAEFATMAGANSAGMVPAGLYNGSVGVELYKRSSDTRVDGYYGSALANAGTITANVFAKLIAAYSATQVTAALNGATPVSATVSTPPPTPNKLMIGNSGGATNPFSGWIKRIIYFPKRLPNAELIEMTQ